MSKVKKTLRRLIHRCFNLYLSIVIIIGVILSAWALLSIEICIIPKVPTNFSTELANGINQIWLGLSYSYIAGVILYWFTVKLPYMTQKRKLKLIIEQKIKNIGIMLSNMNVEFRNLGENPELTDVTTIRAILVPEKWKGACKMPVHLQKNVTAAFADDYRMLVTKIAQLINDYKEYLSSNQILLLESMRESNLESFFERGEAYGFEFNDPIYERLINPEYIRIIENYNRLVNE